jgi:hypothetical protein
MKKQLLNLDAYIIPAFVVDTESKFKLKTEAASSLDPVCECTYSFSFVYFLEGPEFGAAAI